MLIRIDFCVTCVSSLATLVLNQCGYSVENLPVNYLGRPWRHSNFGLGFEEEVKKLLELSSGWWNRRFLGWTFERRFTLWICKCLTCNDKPLDRIFFEVSWISPIMTISQTTYSFHDGLTRNSLPSPWFCWLQLKLGSWVFLVSFSSVLHLKLITVM